MVFPAAGGNGMQGGELASPDGPVRKGAEGAWEALVLVLACPPSH